LNVKNWLKVEQDLVKSKLNYYRSYNTLTKNSIENSIFKNLTKLINGPLFFVKIKNKENINLTLKKLININTLLTALCIRINSKIYSISQLKKILSLNYVKNIVILHKFLKVLLKAPYKKLSSV